MTKYAYLTLGLFIFTSAARATDVQLAGMKITGPECDSVLSAYSLYSLGKNETKAKFVDFAMGILATKNPDLAKEQSQRKAMEPLVDKIHSIAQHERELRLVYGSLMGLKKADFEQRTNSSADELERLASANRGALKEKAIRLRKELAKEMKAAEKDLQAAHLEATELPALSGKDPLLYVQGESKSELKEAALQAWNALQRRTLSLDLIKWAELMDAHETMAQNLRSACTDPQRFLSWSMPESYQIIRNNGSHHAFEKVKKATLKEPTSEERWQIVRLTGTRSRYGNFIEESEAKATDEASPEAEETHVTTEVEGTLLPSSPKN